MEPAVAVWEGGVREDATPGLTHEGGANEAGGVGRREAEEDLGDSVVNQLRRRRHGLVPPRLAVGGRDLGVVC